MHLRSLTLAAAAASFGFASLLPPAALAHEGDGRKAASKPAHMSAEEHPFGRAGDPRKVTRTIPVGMSDRMHFVVTAARPHGATDAHASAAPFASGDIVVNRGETVRFVVRNNGKAMHEMVLGTMKELKEHAELMRKHPGMEHDEPYMAHVAPGKEGEIVWQFTQPGEFHYACLVPGHLEAGMIARIVVK